MKIISSVRALASVAVLAFASGCGPSLTLVTPAPPNRVIEVDREHDRIEISEGVAVAVECHRDGPCKDVRAVSTSPEIVGVYPAHIAAVRDRWGYASEANASSLALVGMKPGRTTIKVWAEGYTSEYSVVVLPVAGVTPAGVAR